MADLSWVFTLCQKLFSVLGIWWKSRKKRFLTSGNFDSRISKCCLSFEDVLGHLFGRLDISPHCETRLRFLSFFSTWHPFPPLWIIRPIASFSMGPSVQKYSSRKMAYASNHLLLCPLNPQKVVGVQVNPPAGSLFLHFIFPFFFFLFQVIY